LSFPRGWRLNREDFLLPGRVAGAILRASIQLAGTVTETGLEYPLSTLLEFTDVTA
jgi:hypothetical protein